MAAAEAADPAPVRRPQRGGAADVARYVTMGVSGVATFGLVGYFGLTERDAGVQPAPATAPPAAPTTAVGLPATSPTTVPLTMLLPPTPPTLAPTTVPAGTAAPTAPGPAPPPAPPVEVVSGQSA